VSVGRVETIQTLYDSIRFDDPGPGTAKLVVNENQVLDSHLVEGLEVDAESHPDGIEAHLVVRENVRLENPVHLCFGMLPERGKQHIELDVRMERGAHASFLAHCTFPKAVDVTHSMNAQIVVGEGATYEYSETHVHGPEGGVIVVPKARVIVERGGRFRTEFALTQGRVGRLDIDYETVVEEDGVLEMLAKIFGRNDDEIQINERGILQGKRSRGVLESYVALRDRARAEIRNTLTAKAAGARGHVDCKEIVQDEATASAVPIVDVQHPKAHVTHEAAIGSVDAKQLETLMSRGLSEDEAVDLIIAGMLS
jgi:hypothetical protein